MVVRERDPGGAAVAGVDHPEIAPEAGEIDGGRQTRRAAADDQAVEHRVIRHA
jgi:hypothetical protein